MVLLINQKCGSCKKSLSGGYVQNYSGIGQPFVECSRCGANNDNSGHINEWKLMSWMDKALFFFEHVFSIVVRSVMWLIIVCVILAMMEVFDSDRTLFVGAIAIFVCMVSLSLLRFFVLLDKAIKASNVRMADSNYVAKLERLGLAR